MAYEYKEDDGSDQLEEVRKIKEHIMSMLKNKNPSYVHEPRVKLDEKRFQNEPDESSKVTLGPMEKQLYHLITSTHYNDTKRAMEVFEYLLRSDPEFKKLLFELLATEIRKWDIEDHSEHAVHKEKK